MRRAPWPRLARGIAGFLLGLLIVAGLGDWYGRFVASTTESLYHLFESPDATRILEQPDGRSVAVGRVGLPDGTALPGLRPRDLVDNVAILIALFLSNLAPFSNRNAGGVVIAMIALFATHVAAMFAHVESLFALSFGEWSSEHYGAFAANAWGAVAHFYTFTGIFAVPFLLWWIFSPRGAIFPAAEPQGGDGRQKRKRRRRRG